MNTMRSLRPFLTAFFCAFLLSCLCAAPLFSDPAGSTKYAPLIRSLAIKHGVPEALVHSIIKAESNYNPNALSRKGAVGLMQLMPETAREYGVDDPYVPEDNISAGIRHIKKLMDLYNGDVKLILAAYNAGQSAVKKYGGVPPYPETRNYIKRVSRRFSDPVIKLNKIYTFKDQRGRVVLTNMPYLVRNRLPSQNQRGGNHSGGTGQR